MSRAAAGHADDTASTVTREVLYIKNTTDRFSFFIPRHCSTVSRTHPEGYAHDTASTANIKHGKIILNTKHCKLTENTKHRGICS